MLTKNDTFKLSTTNNIVRCLRRRSVNFSINIAGIPLIYRTSLFSLAMTSTRVHPSTGVTCRTYVGTRYNGCRSKGCNTNANTAMNGLLKVDRYVGSNVNDCTIRINPLRINTIITIGTLNSVCSSRANHGITKLLTGSKGAFLSSRLLALRGVSIGRGGFINGAAVNIIFAGTRFSGSRLYGVTNVTRSNCTHTVHPMRASTSKSDVCTISLKGMTTSRSIMKTLKTHIVTGTVLQTMRTTRPSCKFPTMHDLGWGLALY